MNQQPPDRAPARRAPHGWTQALSAVGACLAALVATAALGVWAAGTEGLPAGATPRIVVAVVVLAVGGTVDITGDAGPLAGTRADIAVLPLSVTLAGAFALARGFLRPLRHRAVTDPRELTGWAARIAALWAVALIVLAVLARATFTISTGGTLAEIGELFGTTPRAGFRADVPLTLLVGLVWLAGVLLLALAVARGAPLPAPLLRFQEPVRPAAYAMLLLLMVCVAGGALAGIVVALTRGHPAETFAVLLLGLPNLVWLALTLGMGATWDGRAEGPFGLPVPQMLDAVVRVPGGGAVNLSTLAEQDARVWWLLPAAAVLLLAAALVTAARTPTPLPLWQHSARMAVALVLTVLMICLTARVEARLGLSLIGLGDLGGGLGGTVSLLPRIWTALGLAALWGLVTGALGGLFAGVLRTRAGSRLGG
ncbi:streptophobe family protein [Streptomyces yaizuensis]|uniref:Streptophobe family protein n=1 Tax=Streptomyces yaizuensis TaxID=2989713 RepID=A0ABQ5P3D1_9ACTN|nr:streptophobe family protein [Streptomyces sp. YSPA8]GLF97059.1 streptophobe family protein [Streptomyces sp. YSPA8]